MYGPHQVLGTKEFQPEQSVTTVPLIEWLGVLYHSFSFLRALLDGENVHCGLDLSRCCFLCMTDFTHALDTLGG